MNLPNVVTTFVTHPTLKLSLDETLALAYSSESGYTKSNERRSVLAKRKRHETTATAFVHFVSSVVLFYSLLGCGCNSERTIDGLFPEKPIKVIVPFGAGGGSDTFTRIVQKAMTEHELLDQPPVIINMPGAGGSIGSRKVKNARPDGYTLLQIHEGMLTNKYSGNTNFGPESFEPIAGTGRMAHVIAVAEDSPYQDLTDLLNAAAEQPDSIVFAVGIGAPSHFAGLMLENASTKSAEFRFTQSGGGAKRFASLLGGHSSVSTFSVAEFVEFQASGLRALAILSEERHAKVPDVSTAIEQGINVNSTNMHFWWAPKGTPPERVGQLAGALRAAIELPEVTRVLSDLATEPVVVRGEDLVAELSEREREIGSVSQRSTADVPDLGLVTLALCTVLGVAVFQQRVREHALATGGTKQARDLRSQGIIVAAILGYVFVLQFFSFDYRLATGIFVLLVGGYLTRGRKQLGPAVGLMALLLGFGLHFLFTRVLVVDLP